MLPENPNEKLQFDEKNIKDIYLAGGCFWGTDAYLKRVVGVYYTESGYANGKSKEPVTYKGVKTGTTGHAETVFCRYDRTKISLEELLMEFFSVTNPTTLNQQAEDIGTQYRSGIYYTDEADKPIIEKVISEIQKKYEKPIVTEVLPLTAYQPAEDYHQNYLEKNPDGYCHISF